MAFSSSAHRARHLCPSRPSSKRRRRKSAVAITQASPKLHYASPVTFAPTGCGWYLLQTVVRFVLALLKMLAQSSKCIRERRSKPVKTAFADIRKRIKESTG